MARRADHTREELTELAITAGLELIRREGFAHFSGRKVAASIGYTVGTLYNVFGSYDDMILHINARTLDEWYEFMQAALAKKKSGNALHVLARAYIEYSRAHYHQWTVLFEYRLSEDRELPQWYVVKMTRFFIMVEQLLYPMLNKDRGKARRSAHVLWAGIHGICILSLSRKLELVNADSAETLALCLIDQHITGLINSKKTTG